MSAKKEAVLTLDGEPHVDKEHPIFSKDPDQWMKLVHTQVCVTTEDGNQHRGWVYTVDPVSESIVLVDCLNPEVDKAAVSVEILMGRTILEIESLSTSAVDNEVKQCCDRLFRPGVESSTLTEEEILTQRDNLKLWLEKHRIPVTIGGHDGHSLSVLSDALIIQPPFTEENCLSTNEIILSKIQGLVRSMP